MNGTKGTKSFVDVVAELLAFHQDGHKRWVAEYGDDSGYTDWFCGNVSFPLPSLPSATDARRGWGSERR
jgi:hypothetical protein